MKSFFGNFNGYDSIVIISSITITLSCIGIGGNVFSSIGTALGLMFIPLIAYAIFRTHGGNALATYLILQCLIIALNIYWR